MYEAGTFLSNPFLLIWLFQYLCISHLYIIVKVLKGIDSAIQRGVGLRGSRILSKL